MTSLDLHLGYWQIRMHPNSVEKTAFRTPLGSFAWRVMGMGLSNAAPTLDRLMDSIFWDLDFVFAWLDDTKIASQTEALTTRLTGTPTSVSQIFSSLRASLNMHVFKPKYVLGHLF